MQAIKKKIERIKKGMHNNLYFYAGGEIDLEEKVSYGYNRLSSIAGNVYPNEVFQWFQNLLTEQIVSKQESEKNKKNYGTSLSRKRYCKS